MKKKKGFVVKGALAIHFKNTDIFIEEPKVAHMNDSSFGFSLYKF